MGKKMGINTKAVEARERKDAQKRAKRDAAEKKQEEEYWKDDDKHINRKLDRQKVREQKMQEEKERKAALKEAYEKDMELAEKSAKAKATKHQPLIEPTSKVTRHEIQKNLDSEETSTKQLSKQLKKVNLNPIPLVPNLNRLEDGENASTIDQALDLFHKNNSTATTTSRPK